jgi:hypothetical protein
MLLAKVAARRTGLGGLVALALLFVNAAAWGGEPTTADCLAASDASLEAGNEGRLRDERAQLHVCAAASCPDEIRTECSKRAADVSAKIPTVAFFARDSAGRDRAAVRVTLDGEPLADRLEGVALSIDPGEHTFVFETAGEAPVTKKLVLVQGQKDRREVVVFGPPHEGPAALPGASDTAPRASLPAAPPRGGLGAQRVMALVAGGLGVVGLGLGAAFGAIAMVRKDDAEIACPDQCPTQAGADKWKAAAAAGDASTFAFAVGGAGIVAAAVLWWTAPSAKTAPSAYVGLGPGTLGVRGTW